MQVIKDYRRMVMSGIDQANDGKTDIQFAYKEPRKCLQIRCQFMAEDPVDMFKHIKYSHVKDAV